MRFYDLCTAHDVARLWAQADAWDPLDPANQEAVAEAISAASRMVERYCGRNFIVRLHKERFTERSGTYVVRAWPIVEVKEPADALILDEATVKLPSRTSELHYYAGYRRADQDLAALQLEHSDLTQLPELLPEHIRDVTAKIVVVIIRQSLSGIWGGQVEATRMGEVIVRIGRTKEIEDLLRELDYDRSLYF